MALTPRTALLMAGIACLAVPAQAQSLDSWADSAAAYMPAGDGQTLDQIFGPVATEPLPELTDLPGIIPTDPADTPIDAVGATGQGIDPAIWSELEGELNAAPDVTGPTDAIPAQAPTDGPVAITPAEPPADWVWHDFNGNRFATPPGFEVMEDTDETFSVIQGDIESRVGLGLGLGYERNPEDMADAEGATVIGRGVFLFDGNRRFPWVEAQLVEDGISLHSRVVYEEQTNDGNDHLMIMALAFGQDLTPFRPVLDQMLQSVRLAPVAAVPEAQTAPLAQAPVTTRLESFLMGMAQVPVPGDWSWGSTHEGLQMQPPTGAGRVRLMMGYPVTQPDGILSTIPAGTSFIPVWLGDGPARTYTLPDRDVTVFETCPYEGEPLALEISGPQSFRDGPEVAAILMGLIIRMPSDAAPCNMLDQTGPTLSVPDTPPATTAQPETGIPAPGTQTHAVAGISLTLPADWTLGREVADAAMFQSTDRQLTLTAMWWQPDEPLTGTSDITDVAAGAIGGEPATLITSQTQNRLAIQGVTERARPDGSQFVLLLEGSGIPFADLSARHAAIAGSLLWGTAFDAPDATDAPVTATAPVTIGRTVDFRDGSTGGWSGYFASLSNPGSGGPDGAGYLSAFTPGDGTTGYFVAPVTLLGDWTGYGGLQITLRTGSGDYIDPYAYGGYGDIAIISRGKSASLAFDTRIGTAWQTAAITLADHPGWRFDGGAQSLADILPDVTAFHIRAEYLLGDATADLAQVVFLPASEAAPANQPAPVVQEPFVQVPQPPVVAVTPPPAALPDPDNFTPGEGGYTTYTNARFGVSIPYPASYFSPLAPPDNGDGRSFVSVDGQARFHVFGQFDVFNLTQTEMMAQDRAILGNVSYTADGPGWYVLSAVQGNEIAYLKVITDGPGATIRRFQINYPTTRRSEFDPVVTYMAGHFGPPPQIAAAPVPPPATAAAPDVSGSWALIGNGFSGRLVLGEGPDGLSGYLNYDAYRVDEILSDVRFDPQTGDISFRRATTAGEQHYVGTLTGDQITGQFNQGQGSAYQYGWTASLIARDDGTTAAPAVRPEPAEPANLPQSTGQILTPIGSAVTLGQMHTPARGTAERAALMDAARVPIQNEIGLPVIFVASVLNSDGSWAFLQGTPVNPDGTPLNWARTRFAQEMAAGFMSDTVMVLMRNVGGRWEVVQSALGPTDVAWIDWMQDYGLPERLFQP